MMIASLAWTLPLVLAQSGNLSLPKIGGTVYSGAGSGAAAIRAAVDEFRAAAGTAVNPPGSPGSADGRREINWDGVPDAVASPNDFPADFFNRNSARGAVFSGPAATWTGFQVSSNESVGQVRFDNLGSGYSSIFQTFSSQRLFTSVGTHEYDVDFFVPGTEDRGSVSGFGAVFCNVALPTTSSLEFFTSDGVSLGKYYVRVAPKGLSFLGVTFPGRIVAKVRITPGNTAAGAEDSPDNGVNVVVVDDFIYGEPVKR